MFTWTMAVACHFLTQFLSFDIGQSCSGFLNGLYWEATPWIKISRDPLRSSATLTLSLTEHPHCLTCISISEPLISHPPGTSHRLCYVMKSPLSFQLIGNHYIELPHPFSLAGYLSGSYHSSIQCLVGKPDNRRKAGVPMSFILGNILARDQHRVAYTILSMKWSGAVLSKPPFRVCPVHLLDDCAGHMGNAQ